MEPSRSRREARSHQITGLARWNAKDRSDLHSRTDANALRTHSRAEMRSERCGIGRRRRAPVGMASVASQRPIARIAASGSAKLWLLTCDLRHHHAISAEYARFPRPRERQAPITQLATKHRDPRQARRQPGGETGQKGCDDILTLGRAVCTHRMRLGGSRQRLGNGGCRQRVYDAGNRL